MRAYEVSLIYAEPPLHTHSSLYAQHSRALLPWQEIWAGERHEVQEDEDAEADESGLPKVDAEIGRHFLRSWRRRTLKRRARHLCHLFAVLISHASHQRAPRSRVSDGSNAGHAGWGSERVAACRKHG